MGVERAFFLSLSTSPQGVILEVLGGLEQAKIVRLQENRKVVINGCLVSAVTSYSIV